MSRSPAAPSQVSSGVSTFIVSVLVIASLYFAKPVVVPLACAILLAFVLSPLVSGLERFGLPRLAAVVLIVVAVGSSVAGGGWLLGRQMMQFAEKLPAYEDQVVKRISELRSRSPDSAVKKVEGFVEKVTEAATAPAPGKDGQATAPPSHEEPQPVRVVNPSERTWQIGPIVGTAAQVLEFFLSMALTLVLVIYILMTREDLRNRIVRLAAPGHLTQTTRAVEEAAHRLSKFLLAQLTVNTCFGLFIGLGLSLLKVPYPLLWGGAAGFLRYIPYIGGWIAAVLPIAMTIAVQPGWTHPAAVASLFLASELTTGFVIEPLSYGHGVGVSPAALLVAVAFWSWLWGAMGLLLAVPVTIVLVVMARHIPQIRFLDVLMGDEPALPPAVELYQRLIAQDQGAVHKIVEEQSKKMPVAQVYDEILVPALVNARREFESGLIADDDVDAMLIAVREIVDKQAAAASNATDTTGVGTAVDKANDSPLPQQLAPSDGRILPGGQRMTILGCPAQDRIDEAGLLLLQSLLDPSIWVMDIVSADRLASEVADVIKSTAPSVVCLGSIPPGELSRTRLRTKRMRAAFPDLKLMIGRWGLKTNVATDRERLAAAGADFVATTLAETRQDLAQLVELLKASRRVKGAKAAGAGAGAAH